MTVETMNVHQALVELKTLDKRIGAAIREPKWVVPNKHSNKMIGGVEVEVWVADVQAKYQKVTDLIKRRDAIKRAVVNSNAVTRVVVAGKEYTVAEAIDRKNHGVEFLKLLAQKIVRDYTEANVTAEKANGVDLELRADNHVKNVVGNSDVKGATAEILKVRRDFVVAQTMELVDPIGALKEVEKLDEEVTSFLMDVDAVLSTSNATTQITVEY